MKTSSKICRQDLSVRAGTLSSTLHVGIGFRSMSLLGVLITYVCPHCGGEYPFFNDDYFDFEADPPEDEYKPTNRQHSKTAKKSKFWCSKCYILWTDDLDEALLFLEENLNG